MYNKSLTKLPAREQAPEVRRRNFEEVSQGYDEAMAQEEASRCIACKNPACMSGCPVGVHIPDFITHVKEGEFEKAYETIRLLGELYGLETRAQELTKYLKGIQTDLDTRTAKIADDQKPSVYVGGVSFKGNHGFEGTEAGYGPFALIHAKNLADTTGQTGAFNIDTEQVLAWDPDVIFLDFNGMDLINEDYQAHPEFYQSLSAVRGGKVYSQISFRSCASNLETALADAYYAACMLYPEQFADIDPEVKAGEIFTELLGSNPYPDLKEAGYAFRTITIGE